MNKIAASSHVAATLEHGGLKIAVIGATGNVGRRIVDEALGRGHAVTAISRRPEKLPSAARLRRVPSDVSSVANLAAHLEGHDVVVSSVAFLDASPHDLIEAVQKSGVPRYVCVGGAGSLWIEPGTLFVNHDSFPQEVLAESHAGFAMLDALQQCADVDWTMLTPSAVFFPGQRTGAYRTGRDDLLFAPDGQSSISYEDYALALIDEVETPTSHRQRITVGY